MKIKLIAKRWAWELVPYRSAGSSEQYRHGKEVSIATLWAGTAPACSHHLAPSHWQEICGKKILTIPYTYLNPRIGRVGGLGARIRNDSQKLKHKWSAEISWKQSKSMPRGVLQAPRGHLAGHVHKWGVTTDCIGSRLTLPKFHLATFILIAKRWAWELVPYRSVGSLSTTGTSRRYPWQPCEREPPKLTRSPRCLERGGVSEQGDTEPPNCPQTTPSTAGFQPVLGNKKENNRNTHTVKSADPPAEGAKGQSCYRNQR